MKDLTRAEAVVLRSLLACQPITEGERIRRSALPARTFEVVRRRAYDQGWVVDRYVPDPVAIGSRRVTFSLLQPFAEEFASVERELVQSNRVVLLWRWPNTLFSVSFGVDDPISKEPSGAAQRSLQVPCDPHKAHIPVYFDFEATFAQLTEQAGVLDYPHSLPRRLGACPQLQAEQMRRAGELVRHPFRESATGPLRVSPFFLPRSQQRLLRTGIIERRTFLRIAELPAYEGRRVEHLVFIHGALRAGSTAANLFLRLGSAGVRPFLFVTDGSKVLLGTVSPAPNLGPTDGERPSVLAILQRYLEAIETVREPVRSLSSVIDHRYDRLFGAS